MQSLGGVVAAKAVTVIEIVVNTEKTIQEIIPLVIAGIGAVVGKLSPGGSVMPVGSVTPGGRV